VFYYLHFQLLAIASITVLLFYAVKRTTQKMIVLGSSLIIAAVLSFLPYRFSYRQYSALKKLPKIKETYRAGFRTEATEEAEKLRPSIGATMEYLDFMSFVYASEGQAEQAITITNRLLDDKVTNNILERLGNQYYAVGNYAEAENAYTLCVNMVPNRFLTRHTLFNFYKKTGQKRKAVQCGKEILALPVKIPSYQVEHVIKSVQVDLANMLKSPS
jgi:tetratricopeptide (TPR) repeat protein